MEELTKPCVGHSNAARGSKCRVQCIRSPRFIQYMNKTHQFERSHIWFGNLFNRPDHGAKNRVSLVLRSVEKHSFIKISTFSRKRELPDIAEYLGDERRPLFHW